MARSQNIYSYNMKLLLQLKDTLLVLKNAQPPYQVIIDVPHQATIGISKIAERWRNASGGLGRDSDENAASYALVSCSHLCHLSVPCKLVIACHCLSFHRS